MSNFAGTQTAPEGVDVYNPAFDVVEARDIAAIITDRGVIEKPDIDNIAEQLARYTLKGSKYPRIKP